MWSRDSSVGLAMDYGLDCPDSIPGRVKFFFSPQRPDRIWGSASLLPIGNRVRFPRG
jgi:hypothetical protein